MKNIITILTTLILPFLSHAQQDSSYILHRVEPKETLYSLVKRYNTTFATVENLNPELSNGNSDIKVGQIIKFPKTTERKVETAIPSVKKTTYHIVQPKETVFSISKLYNVDISNLVEANKISDNTIRVGQKLIVDGATLNTIVAETPKEAELLMKPIGRNVRETGIAAVINTPSKSTKYLALHRTAPLHSNIKITNEATGHTVVAKVIGKLNSEGPDKNVLVKLSPYAYYQLRPKDSKLRASVEYYLEEDVVIK